MGGAVLVALGRLSAVGRLPRNLLAGIRIPSTMRSNEAWLAGHHAAASALTAAGFGPIMAAVVTVVWKPSADTETVLFRIATGWLLGWLGFATFQASRAARAEEAA